MARVFAISMATQGDWWFNPSMIIYFFFLIFALLSNYLLQGTLHLLSLLRLSTQKIPVDFADLVSTEKFLQAQAYARANHQFSLLQETYSLLCFFLFWWLNGFAFLEQLTSGIFSGVPQGIVFLFSFFLLSWAANLPFDLYHTFVLEEKFGFNRTTAKTYAADLAKGSLLSLVLGVPILWGVLSFLGRYSQNSWWMIFAFLVVVQIVLLFVAPTWIMPLFNKFSPLDSGELKEAIEKFAKKVDFELSGIFSMDGSKRSAKANAFFTGFGKNRRIVLFDTLVQKHTTGELVAILAHEIGHAKLKHIVKGFLISSLFLCTLCYLFSLFLNNPELHAVFGIQNPNAASSIVIISILFQPISLFLGLVQLAFSRKNEFEADAYAALNTGRAEDLISGLKKLSVDSLSDLDPHPLKVFFSYSHPPVVQRIEALKKLVLN